MRLRQGIQTRIGLLAAVLLVAVLIAAAIPPATYAQGQVHVVQRGETLYSIARRYGTTVTALVQANGLGNANFIWVGQRLTIPGSSGGGGSTGSGGGGIHVVRWGETLYSIARLYGTSVTALVQANGLPNANYIYAGQRLLVSGSGGGTGSSGGSSGGSGGSSGGSSGGVHVVQRGETLSSIALRYGTTAAAIASANGLRNANLVYVGQRLTIPGGGSSRGGGGTTTTTPTGGGDGKWIDVDLSSQTVQAYQGNTLMQTMIVSTGIAAYPTPTGTFRVYAKYGSVNMSGPGYYLPGVPHTMFFYKGYALHGTYWHDNFGQPMSHGCINLTRSDAAWLYAWTPVGTQVVIHW